MAPSDPVPSFTWNAADYNRNSPAQQLWAQELIRTIRLSEHDRVLDIGCGDGKATAAIAASVLKGSVTGIDSSSEMIRFARDHFPRSTHNNLSFIQMDVSHLEYCEEFDLVFSNAALHWISDHKPLLRGIARSLCPGGRLLVQMGGRGNAAQVFEVLAILLEDPLWGTYYHGFSFAYGFFGPEEYRQWLTDVGLEPVRVDLIPKDMVYADRVALPAGSAPPGSWMARLPESERSAFIEDFIERYLQTYPADSDGSIHVGMMRLEVEAVKSA